KRIETQTTRTAKNTENRFKAANKNVERSFRDVDRGASAAAGGGLRQVSMQLSQVAQQGAATGNYLQALAIQAPDLALGFGALGIAAGAAIPILFGVAQAAMGASEEIEKLDVQGAYSAAASAIDAAREAQDRYSAAVRLSGVYQREVTAEVLSSLRLEAQAREALAALEVERLNRQRRTLEANLAASREQLDRLLRDVNQGLEFDPNADFMNSEVERARLQAVQDVLDANEDLLSSIREQQAELDLVNALVEQGHGEAAEMVSQLLEAATAAGTIAATDFAGTISAAADQAARLADNMEGSAAAWAAFNAARAMAELPPGMTTGEGITSLDLEGGNIDDYLPPELPAFNAPRFSTQGRKGRSGGGGSGKSEAERKAEQETNRLLSERDRILRDLEGPLEEYERKLADLNELQKRGELTTDQYNAALARLDEQRMQAEWGAVIEGIESVSDAMANAIVNGENMGEALGNIFRGIAADILSAGIREALMSVFNGTMQGGGGGGFLGGIMSAISSVIGGRRAAGGPVSAGRAYMVGEAGPEPFVPAVNGRILSTAQAQQALRGPSQGQAAGGIADVRVFVDRDGNWQAAVERISAVQAQAAAGSVLRSVNRGFGDRFNRLRETNT
ncbi:hypothetical protein, partial [Roseivivax isoporae]